MTEQFVIRSYRKGFDACESLTKALRYLRGQYSDGMTRDEAQAHFDARCLLINRVIALVDEMELEYLYGASPALPEKP